MDFRFTQEQEEWREEIRQLIEDNLTPELIQERNVLGENGPGPEQERFMRMLGQRGLLGISWPKEYGGLERSLIDQYIFSEDCLLYTSPSPRDRKKYRMPSSA